MRPLPAEGTSAGSKPRNAEVWKCYSPSPAGFALQGPLPSPGLESRSWAGTCSWAGLSLVLLVRVKRELALRWVPSAGNPECAISQLLHPHVPTLGGSPRLREVTLWLLSLPLSNQAGQRARISHPSRGTSLGGGDRLSAELVLPALAPPSLAPGGAEPTCGTSWERLNMCQVMFFGVKGISLKLQPLG